MRSRRSPKFRFSRRLLLALGVVGLAGVLGAWGLWLQARGTQPTYVGPVEHISTGLIGEYAALVFIAEDQGYFREAGLNVTIKEYPSGPAAVADLLAGKLDTAMGSDFAGVRNSFAGEDLRILATMSKSEAFDMISRRDHGIQTIADLKGKRIGVTRKTVGEFYLGQFLTFNNLGASEVTVVDLTQEKLVEALQNGQVDAAVLFEPNAYQAKSRLGAQAVRWSVQSDQNIYSLLYSTSKLTTQRPQAIERYLRAVVRAERFVAGHDAQARMIIARRLNYDDDYLDYIWPKFNFTVSLDQELLLNMDDEARWVIENQLTASHKPPNYLRLMYLPGLEAVKPEGVTIIR
jgi:NitT/TauT family transport system substrate-binding protein